MEEKRKNYMSREEMINFAREIRELLERKIESNSSRRQYMQYTKDLIKLYVRSPFANQNRLRDVSRFICRNSMVYQKLISYYAAMPLFYYNITQTSKVEGAKDVMLNNYFAILKRFEKFKLKKECYNALYLAIRDGMYVGYTYDSEEDGIFCMPLDCQYCRIYGKNAAGEWIVYFDATFFDKGDNINYIYGSDGAGHGAWDKVFIDGYKKYKALEEFEEDGGLEYRWFKLPPEKTFTLLTCAEDEYDCPLPYFLPLFISLLDLLDLEQIILSKTELENYKLIVNKIPLLGKDDVDDFGISEELAALYTSYMEAVVPDLIGVTRSPMEIEVVNFENSNSSKDTDALAKSMSNLFDNAGAAQLVVAGGSNTSSAGLKYAIQNDESTCWIWVERIQSWLNFFIHENISPDVELVIHKITWYNRTEYINEKKDAATLGGSALDYLTSTGDTPYLAYQKILFENAIGIKDIMIPLQSSYQMGVQKGGAPEKDESDLSEEGIEQRDKEKNGISESTTHPLK